jgi:hypothetical protein
MTVHLDHVIVPSRSQVASARLGGLLGFAWAQAGAGPFSPVYVNDGLTLGFGFGKLSHTISAFASDKQSSILFARIKAAESNIAARCEGRGHQVSAACRNIYWND